MEDICFRINSRKDYIRLLKTMEKTKIIHWSNNQSPLKKIYHGFEKFPVPVTGVFLRIPSSRITPTYSTNLIDTDIMTIDSRQVLSMRSDGNKFKIYTKS